MHKMMIPLMALSIGSVAMPALAQDDHGHGGHEQHDNGRHEGEDHGRGHDDNRGGYYQARDDRHDDRRGNRNESRNEDRHDNGRDWQRGRYYSHARPDPRYGAYYADNYYRAGPNYGQRVLGANDRIYRGRDNRYYCRRSDGTTGLIIGAIGGGTLGNVIAPGGSKTLGSILGGSLGAILGNSIDRGNVTCR